MRVTDGWVQMIELMRTNDLVAISYVEVLLKSNDIIHAVFDQHMSVLEGSIGILPRRVMIDDERKEEARRLVRDAGLAQYLKDDERCD